MTFVADGDDGRRYWFGCSPLSLALEDTDMWHVEVGSDTGQVVQIPGSIYRLADFPQTARTGGQRCPRGALKVQRFADRVSVDLGDFHLVCRSDHSWHYSLEDEKSGIKAEFVHQGRGYPTWYGKDTPSVLTQHSIAYGYNWSGRVEGTITIDGRTVRVAGKGIRERYYSVDQSAAEIGGWEDWAWFHFDEVFGSMYEMRLGSKDMSLNMVDEGQYFPAGDFTIEHHDWAYLRPLGAFIPTRYVVTMETGAGVLEFTARAVGATTWGVGDKVPDTPVVTLNWDALEGVFTYADGRTRPLTNGRGGTSIRLWKPYPSIFAPELGGPAGSEGPRLSTL
ncbi:hypothetical protein [Mycolicibacterium palauense]|uniref:hypothetical protein n=1 Tax=Mycolicibacterium palauense TaxID=2034511 RepID=UPI001145A2DB|nr:hypothetical protein [Mycolicibacterium palauense]